MAQLNVGAMLDKAQDFEHRLESYYADLRDRATRDGIRLLTHYLARHRRHLPRALLSYSPDQIERIRSMYLKYEGPAFNVEEIFKGKELPPAVSGKDLLDVAIGFVEELIRFYAWLAEQRLGEEGVGLFKNLLKIEESHVVELKKTRATDYF